MPRWARRRLGTRVMSRSKSAIEPPSGRSSPVTRLKSVVLPAPLGPMIRRRSPGSTARFTAAVTRSPPNDFSRPRTARAVTGHRGGPRHGPPDCSSEGGYAPLGLPRPTPGRAPAEPWRASDGGPQLGDIQKSPRPSAGRRAADQEVGEPAVHDLRVLDVW